MLRKVRNTKIGLVLAFLFAISMFFWRQSSSISNFFNSDNIISKVGKTPISTTKFTRTLEMNIEQFNQILGKSLTGEEIINFQIHQLALGALINDAVFENEFNNLNFVFDDSIIAKKTKEIIPELYNENNDLNENYLQQFLSQQRLKIKDLIQIVHFDTRNNIFNEKLLNINYPNSFSTIINQYNNHQREIEFIILPVDLIDINRLINENNNDQETILSDYYKENIPNYMSKETRGLKYVLIDKKNYQSSFVPTDNEIFEYYNNNKDLFIKNETRSFLQFNFKTLEEAEKIKNKIKHIVTYNDILLFAENEKLKFNIFDDLNKNEILEEIATSLFSLKINDQSPIIKSPIAYHLVALQNINPSRQSSLNEVKKEISKNISEIDVTNYLDDLENSIAKDISEGLNLEQLSKKYELKLETINNLSSDTLEKEKTEKVFLQSIYSEAFNANLDFTNDIIKLNENMFYVFEVDKITKPVALNFQNIKDIIFNDWKKSKQIDEVVQLINKNKTNKNLLKDLGKKYERKIEYLSLKSSNTNLPKKLINDIFNSDIDNIIQFVNQNEIYISRLLNINMDKLSTDDNDNNISVFNEMRNSLSSELLKVAKITTNDELLNSIINSF